MAFPFLWVSCTTISKLLLTQIFYTVPCQSTLDYLYLMSSFVLSLTFFFSFSFFGALANPLQRVSACLPTCLFSFRILTFGPSICTHMLTFISSVSWPLPPFTESKCPLLTWFPSVPDLFIHLCSSGSEYTFLKIFDVQADPLLCALKDVSSSCSILLLWQLFPQLILSSPLPRKWVPLVVPFCLVF